MGRKWLGRPWPSAPCTPPPLPGPLSRPRGDRSLKRRAHHPPPRVLPAPSPAPVPSQVLTPWLNTCCWIPPGVIPPTPAVTRLTWAKVPANQHPSPPQVVSPAWGQGLPWGCSPGGAISQGLCSRPAASRDTHARGGWGAPGRGLPVMGREGAAVQFLYGPSSVPPWHCPVISRSACSSFRVLLESTQSTREFALQLPQLLQHPWDTWLSVSRGSPPRVSGYIWWSPHGDPRGIDLSAGSYATFSHLLESP